MQFRPQLVTAAAAPPVSVAEAKAHMRIYHEDDDTLIGALIQAAASYLDGQGGILGRCMVSQEWRQDFARWPDNRVMRLPFPDVDPESIEITYFDDANVEQTVAGTSFELVEDAIGSAVVLQRGFNFPGLTDQRNAPVRVTFEAGYGDADDVPQAVRHAVLLIVADLYENRENTVVGAVTVSQLPLGAHTLIAPFRRSGV